MISFGVFALAIAFCVLSLLVIMAFKDFSKLSDLITETLKDPTSIHINPKSLDQASPLARGLYSKVYDLALALKDSSKKQKIRSFDMQRLLDSMREGVLAVHSNGKVLYHNLAFKNLIETASYPLSEPAYIESLRLPSELEKLLKERRLDLHSSESTLSLFIGDIQKYFWCKISPLENSQSEKIGILLVINDVTSSKLDEISRREFTANVSHQLRTPLTLVKGYLETMLDEELSQPHRNYLKIIERHSNQLHHIVDELMTLAKFNDPAVTLDLEPISFSKVIEESVNSAKPIADAKKIAILKNIDKLEKDLILGNSTLLLQAIFNLIENAIKFSPNGSDIDLKVAENAEYFSLEIKDHGPGIEESERDKIFQRFYRGQDTSAQTRGTGLGLAIVKHIIKAHRGEVYVRSRKTYKGSVFVVRIPRLND